MFIKQLNKQKVIGSALFSEDKYMMYGRKFLKQTSDYANSTSKLGRKIITNHHKSMADFKKSLVNNIIRTRHQKDADVDEREQAGFLPRQRW
jgi:hypothetical protein